MDLRSASIRAIRLYATRRASPTGAPPDPIGTKRADCVAHKAKGPESLTKIVPILGVILMVLHVIWPFNLPGLRKRRDFWKIAVVMGLAIIVTALLREQAAISP